MGTGAVKISNITLLLTGLLIVTCGDLIVRDTDENLNVADIEVALQKIATVSCNITNLRTDRYFIDSGQRGIRNPRGLHADQRRGELFLAQFRTLLSHRDGEEQAQR